MRRALSLILAASALALPARADLPAADDDFLHGRYAEAIAEYRAAQVKTPAAALQLARVLLVTGDLAGARAAAETAAKIKSLATEAQILLAELDLMTGEYARVRQLLEPLIKRDSKQLRARMLLGRALRTVGDPAADAIWNRFYDDHETGKLDETKAENLVYLALAARQLRDFTGANDTFKDAVRKQPELLAANLEWGQLFLEKYDTANAEASFADVLKIDPANPDAHVGMARVKTEQQNYDVAAAEVELGKALAVNPNHLGALVVRAKHQIGNAEYAAARATLERALATNPASLEAHTLLAAIHWLADDPVGTEAEAKKVFAINPRYATFYHTIAELAVWEHRYQEAIGLEEQALKIDPKYDLALAELGTDHLRMGHDEVGLRYLRDAYTRDKFNVRTTNILNLFDDLTNSYEMLQPEQPKGVFRLRVPKEERVIIERYLPRTLGRAFADMVKRYGFTPTLPVTIELYNDPEQYSVRTVGLPNLGALAVCFGQVITSLSPSNGNLNWGMILWHELGHVFAIQLSHSRVPRWFTEGLSEYETLVARPEWRRENDIDVWSAYATGKLPSVVELNSRFLRAKDIGDMVVAYHMSSLAVEFIAKRWGFAKIVEALKLFGKGQDTAHVIPAVTGLGIAEFDQEFRKHLDSRFAVYKTAFRVNLADYEDLATLARAAAAHPADSEAQAALALGQLANEDGERAAAAALAALKLDAKNAKAHYALAEVLGGRGDFDGARAQLEAIIAGGADGYEVRLRLGRIALQQDDLKNAELELTRAKRLDPERSEPYRLLAERFAKANRDEDAQRELERYVQIEQMEYPPVKKLVETYAARRTWAKVRDFGEMALFINPFDAELHLALGQANEGLASPTDAVFEYESALASQPPLRRPAIAHLGLARVYAAKKELAQARRALAQALKLEPENTEAVALQKRLGQ